MGVAVGGGIADFTYQIIIQRIFMTKKYELKNILTFVFDILTLGQNATLIRYANQTSSHE
jgi:hypothetical protein